jgi:flavin reductase (DIM6/NTAB) family NADH-FMN oxidoreductase RutF
MNENKIHLQNYLTMNKAFLLVAALMLILPLRSQNQDNPLKSFKHITHKEFQKEAIKLIGDDWMLVTAGTLSSFNMMTANWGGLGWLWNKPVAFIFVRPQRYTHQFTERENYFTLTFFEEKHRDILKLLGTKSGRDIDKMKTPGLTPFATTAGTVAFSEASIIMECKKLYAAPLQGISFTDMALAERIYPHNDFHTLYIGEIVNIWIK